MEISVIICTHNPRPHYLQRVLAALQAQTLPASRWELLLVDNASREPLEPAWDLSWHPHARHVREEKLGNLHARARAIREARGEIMVYVDDDNVMAQDYLATAEAILRERPHLGAIGTGNSVGEFEVPPPKEVEPHLYTMALVTLERDLWTNFGGYNDGVPPGAGMCFRRVVGEDYLRKLESDPVRRLLGRTGTDLGAGEDVDLALCAHDLGLGTGRFLALKFTHLIPRERLNGAYFTRLYAGFARASEILHVTRHGTLAPRGHAVGRRLKSFYRFLTRPRLETRIASAEEQARDEVRRLLANLKNGLP